MAKACALLDTSWAGMVAHDDLLALEVLAGRCAPGPIGVLGFSGEVDAPPPWLPSTTGSAASSSSP